MEFRLKGNLLNWEVKFGGRKGEVEGVCVCVCVCVEGDRQGETERRHRKREKDQMCGGC
jgi:hypothetical protein